MLGKWINRFFERRYATEFKGTCPDKPWAHLYGTLPFTLMEMAERNEPKAAYVLGDMFDQGSCGLDQNLDKAIIYYQLAAKIEDPDALNNLGSMHHHGDGLPQSLDLARSYYERAVAGHCAAAMNNLGRMYLEGQGGLPIDPQRGIQLLQQGAQAHNGDAALKLATIHRDGAFGHPKSQRRRIYWLWKAAHNGSGVAYNVLGDLYKTGTVLPQNDTRAFELYHHGVECGDADSMYQVGLAHLSGQGAPKDRSKARQFLQMAAAYGYDDPDDFLGRLQRDQ